MRKGTLLGAMVLALGSACGGGGAGQTATGQLQVVARCQTAASTLYDVIYFKVLNASDQPVAFTDITVHYYLTYEVMTGATPVAEFDYVQNFELGQITRKFSSHDFELGFTASAGALAASDDAVGSGEIAVRIHANDFSAWNSSKDDDYSFSACDGANSPTYVPRPTMTAYVGDTLAWGVEP